MESGTWYVKRGYRINLTLSLIQIHYILLLLLWMFLFFNSVVDSNSLYFVIVTVDVFVL